MKKAEKAERERKLELLKTAVDIITKGRAIGEVEATLERQGMRGDCVMVRVELPEGE